MSTEINESLCGSLSLYLANNLSFIPIRPGYKYPPQFPFSEFDVRELDPTAFSKWFSRYESCNFAIQTGKRFNLLVLDADTPDGLSFIESALNCKVPTVVTAKGKHFYFLYPDFHVSNSVKKVHPGIDVRSDNAYVMAPPSRLRDATTYQWEVSIEDVKPDVLPPTLYNLLKLYEQGDRNERLDTETDSDLPYFLEKELAPLTLAVQGNRNSKLYEAGSRIGRLTYGDDELRAKAESALRDRAIDLGLSTSEISRTVKSAFSSELATTRTSRTWSVHLRKVVPTQTLQKIELRLQNNLSENWGRTDSDNARFFSELFDGILKYEPQRKAWFVWSDNVWRLATDPEIVQYAVLSVEARDRLARMEGLDNPSFYKWISKSKNSGSLKNIVELAKGIIDPNDLTSWDRKPDLLAFKNGVFDFNTERFGDGNPYDFLSSRLNFDYDPTAKCPQWENFLLSIFEGDVEVVDWIQKAIGYTLTGRTSEHLLFICFGQGSNGKSTFLDTLRSILGAYAHTTSFRAFDLSNKNDAYSLPSFEGKRLSIASETNPGERLNVQRVKELTGSASMSVRPIYDSEREIPITTKIWLACNHLPEIWDHSNAIQRRLKVIPFNRTYRSSEIDDTLCSRLENERRGIINWGIEGELRRRMPGQKLIETVPSAVKLASAVYLSESNPVLTFVKERCEKNEARTSASILYQAYQSWSQSRGTPLNQCLNQKSFGNQMKALFKDTRRSDGVYYVGVSLRDAGEGCEG